MQDLLEEFLSSVERVKVLGWKETRPWHDFFATFKPVELNHHYVSQRVTTNMVHYRSNYLLIAVLVLLIRIIFSPLLLITLCVCGGICYYAFIVHDRSFVFGDIEIDGSKKAIACAVLTFTLLALTGSITSLMWTFVIVLLINGLHALFRPRSISARTEYAYEDAKYSWTGGSSTGTTKEDVMDDPENPSSASSGYAESGVYPGGDGSVRKRGGGAPRAEFIAATGSSKKD
jgi:hypothetical protein